MSSLMFLPLRYRSVETIYKFCKKRVNIYTYWYTRIIKLNDYILNSLMEKTTITGYTYNSTMKDSLQDTPTCNTL